MQNFRNAEFAITSISGAVLVDTETKPACAVHRNRPFHGVVYKISGEVTYNFKSKNLDFSPEYICYLPKGSSYNVSMKKPGKCIAVNFDAFDPENGTDIEPFSIKASNSKLIRSCFEECLTEYVKARGAFSHKCMSILYNIICLMKAELERQYFTSETLRRFSDIEKLISENFRDSSLSVKRLADLSGLSETRFRAYFSGIYGESPKAYVNSLRIMKARELLVNTDKSVGEIAGLCGFSDIYYFSRIFKQKTLVSPSEYRNGYYM